MTQAPSRPYDRHVFKIAIICALPLEAGMVESVFDKFWNDDGRGYGKVAGDQNAYTEGMIGDHNVVLAHMPGMGSNSAATVAAGLRSSFRGIEIAFVVGICGVVPTHIQTKQEIVLGDCIISTAVVQYDFGRQYPHGFVKKDSVQDSLGRASTEIRSLISMLTTPRNQKRLAERLAQHLETLQRKRPEASHPGWRRDRLFQPSYIHQHHQDVNTCDACLKEVEICSQDCGSIGCEDDQLVKRKRFQDLQASLPGTGYSSPNVHFGRFGSANTVMKSGLDRDRIAEKDELIAFEMEGSGVWDSFPTIVVKSACDYADSHKSKEWQPYAAATAAAGLKALLEKWEVIDEPSEQNHTYHVPFNIQGIPVTRKFIDRPTEMQILQDILLPESSTARRNVFVLHGLGGIGKTQLAIEFIRRHHAKFSAVFWLDGSSEDNLKQKLARYASKIPANQISEASKTYAHNGQGDVDAVVNEILSWLAQANNKRWLMVLDNVDRELDTSKPDPLAYDVERYFPGSDHGAILITTRLVRMEQLGESQEVKRVDSDTAQDILRSWYKKPYNDDESKPLLEHLDGLPLAIAQAGAYLQESGMNMKTYLRFYEEMQKEIDELLRGLHVPLRDYPDRSVWTTWNISYSSILAEDEHVAHLLILWSFLDRNDFWYGIFEEAVSVSSISEVFSKWLGSIASQKSSFADAMRLLRRYSLIEGSEQTDGYSMHAVVHRWVYSYQGLKRRTDLGMLALTLVGYAVPMSMERDYARLQQRLLPHAQTCATRVLDLQAVAMQNSGFDNHFTDWVSRQGNVLDAIHMLGLLYSDQGKLEEAEKMYVRALQGKEEALGAKHTSTLDTVNNLGNLYKNQGKLEEAEKMYVRALQGKEEALGAKHTSTLDTVNNLGNLYKNQGKLEEAEKMYVRALQGKEEALGAKHTSTFSTVNNLGNLYWDQGKLEEAEKMLLQALKGYKNALGLELVKTYIPALNTLWGLGDLYAKTKPDESRSMYVKALSGYTKVRGPSSDICITLKQSLDALDITKPVEMNLGSSAR